MGEGYIKHNQNSLNVFVQCRCELVHDTGIVQWVDKITMLIVDFVIMIANVNLHILLAPFYLLL